MPVEKIKDFKMEHGGARENAGRPKGRLNNTTLLRKKIMADIAHRMSNLASDITPLDAMLELGRTALKMGEIELAAETMTICLPYMHARKAPVAEKDVNTPTLAEIMGDPDPDMMDGPIARG